MKALSGKLIIKTVGAALAAAQIATGFAAPLSVYANEETPAAISEETPTVISEEPPIVISEQTGTEDIAVNGKDTYKAAKYKVTNKALKNAKADVKIRVNKKTLKNKGLTVKGKKNKKNVNITYVPAKELAKAFGAKYKVKNNEVIISTGVARAVFNTKKDGYYFATERKGACGMTGALCYGKPYQRNKVLYIPSTVFENLYANFGSNNTTLKLKNNVLTIKYSTKKKLLNVL